MARGLVAAGIAALAIALVAVSFVAIRDEPRIEPATETGWREQAAVVIAGTGDAWGEVFRALGGHYREPALEFFSGAVESGCGDAGTAAGPFYCAAGERLLIDLSFFGDLDARLGAAGGFARAYVIAHAVGHHVQNLLGATGRVQALRRRVGAIEANQLSVRLELQADCYAGIWARHARGTPAVPGPGGLEDTLAAAAAAGDDRRQRSVGGVAVPDTFTHGSLEQRARWFRRGYESGTLEACDTFRAADL